MAGQPNPYQRPYDNAPPPPPGIGGNYPRGAYQGPPPEAAFQHQFAPQYGAPGSPYGHTNPNLGVTPGLVTGGFIMTLVPCTSWIGLVMCAVGLGEAKKRQAGVGLAWAGIIMGIVWQVLGGVLFFVAEVASASGGF